MSDYVITVRTGTVVQRGFTDGHISINGFVVPAPNFVTVNERVIPLAEWFEPQPKDKL